MKHLLLFTIVLVAVGLVACNKTAESPAGFYLPQGDAKVGQALIHKYQCLSCHTIVSLAPKPDLIDNAKFSITLGGKSTRVKTYADLLTSIINPSHKLAVGFHVNPVQENGVSKMTNYNDIMTVTELVDLVTYLQANYEVVRYRRPNYQFYGY